MTNNKQQDKSAFLLSLASYMGGIREGWRRMRGEVTKRTGDAKVLCVPERREIGWGEGGATREVTTTAMQYRAKGSHTSFERFLRSLPRVDAVDRTVDWVLAQPDNIEEREPDRFANLPSQRMLKKTHRRTTHISKETEHHIIDTCSDESVLSGVSWSRYESERGTVGRGTPPVQREDRPRLDLLLQQIHRQQERMAVAADMDTPPHRPHYVQHCTGGGGGDVREELRRCGWGKCRVTTPSQRQPVAHDDAVINNKGVSKFTHHHHHLRDSEGPVAPESSPHRLLTGLNNGPSNTNTAGRRPANPKMTMVTGLHIRPALVTRKKGGRAKK